MRARVAIAFCLAALAPSLVPLHGAWAMPMPGDAEPVDVGVTSNRGDATYAIPIPLPPGVGTTERSLTLQYSSDGGDGPFGVGWSFPTAEVRRSTRFGIPAFDDDLDTFEFGGDLLVLNPAESTATARRYHTLTESFQRIVHHKNDGFPNRWIVTRTDGTRLKFFGPNATVLRDGATGPIFRWLLHEIEDPYGNTTVFEYEILEGAAYPRFVKYTMRGFPRQPVGTLRQVEFIYEPRPDPSVTFMGGVRRNITKRVDRIEVKTGSTIFRKLELEYADEPGATTKVYSTGRSRLVKAQFFGVGAAESLPAQTFEYNDGGDDPAQQGSGGHWASAPISVPQDLGEGVVIAQVNPEDGYPDLLVARRELDGSVTQAVYLGNGTGWSATPSVTWTSALQAVSGTGSRLTVMGVLTPAGPPVPSTIMGYPVPCETAGAPVPVPEWVAFSDLRIGMGRMRMVSAGAQEVEIPQRWIATDVNGDGADDLLRASHVGEAYMEYSCATGLPAASPSFQEGVTRADVFLNTGSGWARDEALSSSLPAFDLLVVNVGRLKTFDLHPRFVELNGDGRKDLIVMGFTRVSGGVSRVYSSKAYLNRATGWERSPGFDPPVSHRVIKGDDNVKLVTHLNADTATRFQDLNSDGLVDAVKTEIHDPGGLCTDPRFFGNGVWLNVGSGWCDGGAAGECGGAKARYLPPIEFEKLSGGSFPIGFFDGGPFTSPDLKERGCSNQSAAVVFSDLNGDGLIDLLRTDGSTQDGSGAPIPGGLAAWIHDPSAANVWSAAPQYAPPVGTISGVHSGSHVEGSVGTGFVVVDADADSAADLVDVSLGGAGSYAGRVRFSDRLEQIANGRGGVLNQTYVSVAEQIGGPLEFLFSNTPGDGVLRWDTRPVLETRSVSGVDVVPSTEAFVYVRPRYKLEQRMSLGFAYVRSVRDGVAGRGIAFSQTHGTSGRPTAIDGLDMTVGEFGKRLEHAEFEYEVLAGDDGAVGAGSTVGVAVGRLVSRTQFRDYGDPFVLEPGAAETTTFEYDPKGGAPFSGYGFVTQRTTVRPTGILVETLRMRAPDTTGWVVGLPEEVLTTDGSDELARVDLEYSGEGRPEIIRVYDGPRKNLASAEQRTTVLAYDAFGNLRSLADPAQRVTEFCYDGDATFESGGSCMSPTTEATHGALVAVRDALGEVTTFKPDAVSGEILETVRLYSGDRERVERDGFGRVKKRFVQPEGQSEILLSGIEHYDKGDSPFFPGQEHVIERAYIEEGDTANVPSVTLRDGFGRAVRVVSDGPKVNGEGRYFGVAVRRDPASLQTTTTLPASCGANPWCPGLFGGSQPRTTETRDALGRTIQVETPDGISKVDYRRVTRTHPDSGSQWFDAVLSMSARGHLTQRIYDGDRLVWVEECANAPFANPGTADFEGVTCASPTVTFHRYAPTGELAETYGGETSAYSDPTKATLRFVFDSLGRVIETHDINKDGPTFSEYDAAGNLELATNARGQAIAYEYDALNRVETITYPSSLGTEVYTLAYDDGATREVETVTKTLGGATVFTRAYEYDGLGRQVEEALAYGQSPVLITQSELDLLGRPTLIRYPDVETDVAYEYEGAYVKRVCELGGGVDCDDSSATPYVSSVTYDAVGRETIVAGWDDPTDEYNPPRHRFFYDTETYRVEQVRVDWPFSALGGERLDVSYTYDPVGNITQIVDGSVEFEGVADVPFDYTYTYDGRNRLASRTWNGDTKHYTYDAAGNLTGKRVAGPGLTNQTYDPVRRHQLTQAGGLTYGYDPDGNVTQRGSQQITFDALDRLVSLCEGASCDAFVYGVDGIRLAGGGNLSPERVFVGDLFEWEPTTGAATARIYALGRQVAFKKMEAATLRAGVTVQGVPLEHWMPWVVAGAATAIALTLLVLLLRGGLLAALVRRPAYGTVALVTAFLIGVPPPVWAGFSTPPGSGTYRRWVWEDPLGTGLHITDEYGYAVHQRAFEPFGEIAKERSSEPTERRFAEHEFEEASGLYYMEARWYDPAAGRFLSVDPVVRDFGAPSSINGYSYVENNPISRVDPSGMYFLPCDPASCRGGPGGSIPFRESNPGPLPPPKREGGFGFLDNIDLIGPVGVPGGRPSFAPAGAVLVCTGPQAAACAAAVVVATVGAIVAQEVISSEGPGAFERAGEALSEVTDRLGEVFAEGLGDEGEFGDSGETPVEEYDSLEAATGEVDPDVIGDIEVVKTQRPEMIARGFTQKVIGNNYKTGERVSAFRNPTTGKFTGGKISSGRW